MFGYVVIQIASKPYKINYELIQILTNVFQLGSSRL